MNNKGADQSARMRRLVCAFVVRIPPKTGFLASRPLWLLFGIGVKGQCETYLKSALLLIAQTPLSLFDRECSYLAQWLPMVCR